MSIVRTVMFRPSAAALVCRLTSVVALALVALELAATVPASASARGTALATLVARPSELPGFSRADFRDEETSRALIYAERALNKNLAQAKAVVPRLRREGFVRSLRERFEQAEAGGVSVVALFATPRGARQEVLANEREELAVPRIERFSDPNLHGAVGFSGTEATPANSFANIYLSVGRCFLALGDQIGGTPTTVATRLAPLAALEAVYRRAKDICA